jgi:hypothetical protein
LPEVRQGKFLFPISTLFGGVAGAGEAEDREMAVAVVFSVGQGGDLDQLLHVLGSEIGCLQG